MAGARTRGLIAFTESVAHDLVLDDSEYAGDQPERFVCCPPLRPQEVVEQLGHHMFNGNITTIGSDHCCYDTAQKQVHSHDVRHMPNGLPGVETRLPVVFSHFVGRMGLTPSRFVELTSTNPARTNGLYPRKGSLMPGADADIAIWDSMLEWTVTARELHMATDYTPYEGHVLRGKPVTVLVRGETVVDDGVLADPTPRGRHLEAAPLDFSGAFSM